MTLEINTRLVSDCVDLESSNLSKDLFMRWEQTTSAVSVIAGKISTYPEKVSVIVRRDLCVLLSGIL